VPDLVPGYLAQETKSSKENGKPGASSLPRHGRLDRAEQQVARLYERGSLPAAEPAASAIDNRAVTVRRAAERYLQSRKDGSLNPIEQDTLYDHYASLLN